MKMRLGGRSRRSRPFMHGAVLLGGDGEAAVCAGCGETEVTVGHVIVSSLLTHLYFTATAAPAQTFLVFLWPIAVLVLKLRRTEPPRKVQQGSVAAA